MYKFIFETHGFIYRFIDAWLPAAIDKALKWPCHFDGQGYTLII